MKTLYFKTHINWNCLESRISGCINKRCGRSISMYNRDANTNTTKKKVDLALCIDNYIAYWKYLRPGSIPAIASRRNQIRNIKK